MVSKLTIDLERIVSEKESFLDDNLAVAVLLAEGWCFLSEGKLYLLCSDTFGYALADAEPVIEGDFELESELGKLFLEWKNDSLYGPVRWVAKKRGALPLPAIVEKMKERGLWDEEMEAIHQSSLPMPVQVVRSAMEAVADQVTEPKIIREMKNWKAEKLLNGETFKTSEKGNSMAPLIKSGQEHILAPVKWEDCEVDDIVYCKVNGRFYTHLVKAKQPNKGLLIGNNRGGVNGWTKNVLGKVIEIL